jgi:hypothetical protein
VRQTSTTEQLVRRTLDVDSNRFARDMFVSNLTPDKNFNEPFSRPNWNGWSNSPSNSRQDRIAAGLDADRVRQLKLKWAFAYPGDVMAYSQAAVVAGRFSLEALAAKPILSMQNRLAVVPTAIRYCHGHRCNEPIQDTLRT